LYRAKSRPCELESGKKQRCNGVATKSRNFFGDTGEEKKSKAIDNRRMEIGGRTKELILNKCRGFSQGTTSLACTHAKVGVGRVSKLKKRLTGQGGGNEGDATMKL